MNQRVITGATYTGFGIDLRVELSGVIAAQPHSYARAHGCWKYPGTIGEEATEICVAMILMAVLIHHFLKC